MSDHDQGVDNDREIFGRLLRELDQPSVPELLPFDTYNRMCESAVTGTHADRVTNDDLQSVHRLRGQIIQAYADAQTKRIKTHEGAIGGLQGEHYELDALRTVVRNLLDATPPSPF